MGYVTCMQEHTWELKLPHTKGMWVRMQNIERGPRTAYTVLQRRSNRP